MLAMASTITGNSEDEAATTDGGRGAAIAIGRHGGMLVPRVGGDVILVNIVIGDFIRVVATPARHDPNGACGNDALEVMNVLAFARAGGIAPLLGGRVIDAGWFVDATAADEDDETANHYGAGFVAACGEAGCDGGEAPFSIGGWLIRWEGLVRGARGDVRGGGLRCGWCG